MIQINFTDEAIRELHYQRYHHPHPRVQQKAEALWLKSQRIPHRQICQLVGVSPNTLRSYIRQYHEGAFKRLSECHFYKPQSQLQSHKDSIEANFKDNPPASIMEAVDRIEKLTGIRRSPTQIRKFMVSIGMKLRKVGTIPSKADTNEQEEFKKVKLEPRLQEAREGNRSVFFVDAVHFVFAPFLGFLWCFSRLFVKAPSGRNRLNVLGAIDAISHRLVMVKNDAYINSATVCDLIKEITALNLGLPITLVLDNARYQKCTLVQEFAANLDIELLYLPPYSPNLNLIERLWKFVKKECLYSKYYADFDSFKNAICNCLSATHTTHKAKLDTLLTLRFQSFKEAQFVAV